MADTRLIGKQLGKVTFPVDRSKIYELALAAHDPDPLYDGDRVSTAQGADTPAPLNWPVLVGHWINGDEMIKTLGIDLRRLLHGQTEWEYVAQVMAGDQLTATRRVGDVTQREGKRGGAMTFIKIETEFHNQREELVAREYLTLIEIAG